MSPAPFVEFWAVNLDPSPNAAGADGQPSLHGYFRHLRDRNWIPQIPPHAPHDDVARIVSPFEWIRGGDGHVSPYQIGLTGFRNETPASATGIIPKTFLNAIFTLDFSEAHHYNPETDKRFGEI
jgi:hypothetical protein